MEQEIDAEIEFHLDEETRGMVARGMAPDAAWLEAQRRFGSVKQARARLARIDRERRMRVRRASILEDFSQDLGYAVRGFRRAPGFAALVIATLGLPTPAPRCAPTDGPVIA